MPQPPIKRSESSDSGGLPDRRTRTRPSRSERANSKDKGKRRTPYTPPESQFDDLLSSLRAQPEETQEKTPTQATNLNQGIEKQAKTNKKQDQLAIDSSIIKDAVSPQIIGSATSRTGKSAREDYTRATLFMLITTHTELRKICAVLGAEMSEVVEQLILAWIDSDDVQEKLQSAFLHRLPKRDRSQ